MLTGRSLALVSLLGLACSSKAPPAEPTEAEAAAEQTPAQAVPAGPAAAKTGCEAADLSLAPATIVAVVDGKPITAGELDPQAAQAESEALRTYCNDIDKIHSASVARAIDEALVAKAAGGPEKADAYLQEAVEKRIERPSAADIDAYYAAHRSPDAPPLEQVRPQVEQAIVRERSQAAYGQLMDELRATVPIVDKLPDVRPAAVDVPIPAHTPTFGDKDAKVTVVEFSDFECPYCSRAATAVQGVKAKYGDKIQFAFRHFPLSFHPNAQPAAEHAQCAAEQQKFWDFHDEVFAHQQEIGPESLKTAATTAGLDMAVFDQCLASSRAVEQVATDLQDAKRLGVGGTPTFYINGRIFNGNPTVEGMSQAIDAELARAAG